MIKICSLGRQGGGLYFFQEHLTFFFFVIKKKIFFWLQWVFVALCGLSLVAVHGGYSSWWREGFSLQCPLLWSTSGRAQQLCVSLVVLWPMETQFTDQGLNPHPLRWKAVLTTGPPEKFLFYCILIQQSFLLVYVFMSEIFLYPLFS